MAFLRARTSSGVPSSSTAATRIRPSEEEQLDRLPAHGDHPRLRSGGDRLAARCDEPHPDRRAPDHERGGLPQGRHDGAGGALGHLAPRSDRAVTAQRVLVVDDQLDGVDRPRRPAPGASATTTAGPCGWSRRGAPSRPARCAVWHALGVPGEGREPDAGGGVRARSRITRWAARSRVRQGSHRVGAPGPSSTKVSHRASRSARATGTCASVVMGTIMRPPPGNLHGGRRPHLYARWGDRLPRPHRPPRDGRRGRRRPRAPDGARGPGAPACSTRPRCHRCSPGSGASSPTSRSRATCSSRSPPSSSPATRCVTGAGGGPCAPRPSSASR